jgi:N-acetylglutamate synthase-like GNAT family acetyltransferase
VKPGRRILISCDMERFLIRRAVLSEQRELEELQLRASLTNAGDRDALLAHPDAIRLPPEQITAGSVFVAERNGAIAGFAAVLPRADGDTELDALFVEPTMRHCGIGRSLVEYCSEAARLQGSAFLHVVGNPHAQNFYLACGFRLTGTAETRFGPGLLMRRIV